MVKPMFKLLINIKYTHNCEDRSQKLKEVSMYLPTFLLTTTFMFQVTVILVTKLTATFTMFSPSPHLYEIYVY